MTVSICFENPVDVGFLRSDVSRAVNAPPFVVRQLDEIELKFLESWAGRTYYVTWDKIRNASAEAADNDWDGYGARPANMMAVDHALRFLRYVPAGLPDPDVSIDPDGEVSLEWYRAPRKTFSVSIGRDGRLSYAGLFGGSTLHGTEAYFADELPGEIRSGLRRVFQ
jgi:hypothetical protein